VNGLTNIWSYSLKDRSLQQITFGTGPDFAPMPDPGGKGLYYVNGKSVGSLTAYHIHSKESTDIVSEDATQPSISPDGKRVMYVTLPSRQKTELWVSDIEGRNKSRIATGEDLGTGSWSPDNFHLSYEVSGGSSGHNGYITAVDGSGLREIPLGASVVWNSFWSPDQKFIYVTGIDKTDSAFMLWKWKLNESSSEKLVEGCAQFSDIDPEGRYILGTVTNGEKTGIYQISTVGRECVPLLPGVVTFNVLFAPDGKSFLYAVASRGEVTIYRQSWRDGKIVGSPQVGLKIPFAFPLRYVTGNAYDFSRDLSTVVYVRPGGHAELYLLSQK
jgi:Tol biopolymer transport system component